MSIQKLDQALEGFPRSGEVMPLTGSDEPKSVFPIPAQWAWGQGIDTASVDELLVGLGFLIMMNPCIEVTNPWTESSFRQSRNRITRPGVKR